MTRQQDLPVDPYAQILDAGVRLFRKKRKRWVLWVQYDADGSVAYVTEHLPQDRVAPILEVNLFEFIRWYDDYELRPRRVIYSPEERKVRRREAIKRFREKQRMITPAGLRHRKLDTDDIRQIFAWHHEGKSITEIARLKRVSVSHVSRIVRGERRAPPEKGAIHDSA